MGHLRVVLSGLLLAGPISAGTFLGTVDCADDDGTPVPDAENFCIPGKTLGGEDVTPFGITHPVGYGGEGGPIVVTVCIDSSMTPSAELIGPTQSAIATWNALQARTGTCTNCLTIEEGTGPSAPVPYHAESAVLHELGHCAMGLGHPNLEFDPPENPLVEGRERTSFTMSYGGSPLGISPGPDGIRGSFDDVQQAAGGMIPESVHWFRIADNNPVIVDGTVIDLMTYSRSIVANLPVGHGWAANANKAVAASLGFPDTQAVMYTDLARGQRNRHLTADDVNMVRMGMTGEDRQAGTAEDYTITLQFVDDCATADISVELLSFGVDADAVGGCGARVDFSFPQPNPLLARHYSVAKVPAVDRLVVALNADLEWDFSVEIFGDSFESGDTSSWDVTVP